MGEERAGERPGIIGVRRLHGNVARRLHGALSTMGIGVPTNAVAEDQKQKTVGSTYGTKRNSTAVLPNVAGGTSRASTPGRSHAVAENSGVSSGDWAKRGSIVTRRRLAGDTYLGPERATTAETARTTAVKVAATSGVRRSAAWSSAVRVRRTTARRCGVTT